MSDDEHDAKPSPPPRKLVEGETVGVFTYVGSNKRGPGGPLPPIGSQVFFGVRPTPGRPMSADTHASAFGALLGLCRQNDRVCPLPTEWSELWTMLPGSPAPLILAAWDAPASAKMRRLVEQLEWARDHGMLAGVDGFLRRLAEDQWHHLHGRP
ncbi:MAG: hypothetical protein KIS87_15135 [Phycisphaeraceae bacterium]|nr:hypothetical protein [Phycisphaeraceae bacterium]